MQKQKTGKPDEPQQDSSKITNDSKLGDAASKAKDALARLDEATAKKRGHWQECCGVRYWVED